MAVPPCHLSILINHDEVLGLHQSGAHAPIHHVQIGFSLNAGREMPVGIKDTLLREDTATYG
jgi:hypothetical protein